jgi:SAM-dependent methyltransferase
MTAMPRDLGSAPRPGWLLDEVANAGRENLDVSHVARYDSKENAGAADEVLLCQELGLTPDSTVVDVGAGTGQFAIAVASACARVIAVDVSPVMLARLRAKVAASGMTNIEVVQAGFLSYEHQGSPADFIYSRYALHHLPDFWKGVALVHLHRFLRPGGVLRLWCTASILRRQRFASKLGVPAPAATQSKVGIERSWRRTPGARIRRLVGCSS